MTIRLVKTIEGCNLPTPEVQKRKRTMEGEIGYNGLSDKEEEEWKLQQQGM
jgi:hypothetical protein